MREHWVELSSPAIGTPRRSSATGTTAGRCWCSPRSGPAPATSRATAWSTRSPTGRRRPGQAVLRRLARRGLLGGPATAARGAGPAARRLHESWLSDQVVPYIDADVGGGGSVITVAGCSLGAYHAVHFACKRADLVPLAIVPVRQLRPVDLARLGRARRRDLLRQPDRLRRRTCTVTTSSGCARGCRCCWSVGQGPWETHRPGRSNRPGSWPDCLPRRGSATSSTCGATTSPTTGRGGARSSRTTCHASADPHADETDDTHGRTPTTSSGCCSARRRTGRRAFEALVRRLGAGRRRRRPATPLDHRAGARSSRSTCATRPATTWSSTGSRTGTTTRASG